jgi:hypothetical protein
MGLMELSHHTPATIAIDTPKGNSGISGVTVAVTSVSLVFPRGNISNRGNTIYKVISKNRCGEFNWSMHMAGERVFVMPIFKLLVLACGAIPPTYALNSCKRLFIALQTSAAT